MLDLTIHTDGGSRGNPGKSACAFVVSLGEAVIFEQGLYLGIKTNNEAEYLGVLGSLKWLKNRLESPAPSMVDIEQNPMVQADQITLEQINSALPHQQLTLTYLLDSLLVVEQLRGHWKIKDARMRVLWQECQAILANFNFPVTFSHIPREENARADALVNATLDQKS